MRGRERKGGREGEREREEWGSNHGYSTEKVVTLII